MTFAEEVLAWAKTKPADEKYDPADSMNCALAQFSKHIGNIIDEKQRPQTSSYFWELYTGKTRLEGMEITRVNDLAWEAAKPFVFSPLRNSGTFGKFVELLETHVNQQ